MKLRGKRQAWKGGKKRRLGAVKPLCVTTMRGRPTISHADGKGISLRRGNFNRGRRVAGKAILWLGGACEGSGTRREGADRAARSDATKHGATKAGSARSGRCEVAQCGCIRPGVRWRGRHGRDTAICSAGSGRSGPLNPTRTSTSASPHPRPRRLVLPVHCPWATRMQVGRGKVRLISLG